MEDASIWVSVCVPVILSNIGFESMIFESGISNARIYVCICLHVRICLRVSSSRVSIPCHLLHLVYKRIPICLFLPIRRERSVCTENQLTLKLLMRQLILLMRQLILLMRQLILLMRQLILLIRILRISCKFSLLRQRIFLNSSSHLCMHQNMPKMLPFRTPPTDVHPSPVFTQRKYFGVSYRIRQSIFIYMIIIFSPECFENCK